jgi:hypothetical protein
MIMMMKSVKMVMLVMTKTGDCVLTSMRRSQVKNPGKYKREDIVIMGMVKMRILTTEMVVIMMIFRGRQKYLM